MNASKEFEFGMFITGLMIVFAAFSYLSLRFMRFVATWIYEVFWL